MKKFNLNKKTEEILILKEKLKKNIKELEENGINFEDIMKELGGISNE